MSALLGVMSGAVLLAQVELRRDASPLPESARVTAVGAEGVTLSVPSEDGRAGTRALLLGWEYVRSVGGEFAEPARPFADLADKAWRAHTRLERGDPVSAEPLLEDLFTQLQGRGGPTAAMVCEGLLRCRLRRGAQLGAIDAWLAVTASRAPLMASSGTGAIEWARSEDPGLVDPATGLAPSLPPIWIGAASLQAWAAAATRFDPATPAGVMEGLYRQAARFECGLPVVLTPQAPEETGARLVWEIVQSRAGNPEQRSAARGMLTTRLGSTMPGWQEAWCRAALGRSILKEESVDSRRLGVVEMLHVPARLADDSPYLAGVALAETAVELKRQGDEAGAARLRAELAGRFPDHQALRWEALRGWATPPPRPAPAKSEEEKKEEPAADESGAK